MANDDAGIALIVVGVVLMVFGFFAPPICGIGVILLIVGVVLVVMDRSRTPMYAYPAYPAYPYPPAGPAAPPQGPGAAGTPGMAPPSVCPVCASPLTWIPQYGRWYCYRCQAYR